jgi:hypothetical protein
MPSTSSGSWAPKDLIDGDPGVVSLMPLWAAMFGASLYRLLVVIYGSIRRDPARREETPSSE